MVNRYKPIIEDEYKEEELLDETINEKKEEAGIVSAGQTTRGDVPTQRIAAPTHVNLSESYVRESSIATVNLEN